MSRRSGGGLSLSPAIGVLLVLCLTALMTVGVQSRAVADTPGPLSSGASTIDAFNYYRSTGTLINGSTKTALGAVTENSSWSSDAAAHANYMNQTNTAGHSEDPLSSYYSAGGNTAAQNSVLSLYGGTHSASEMADNLMTAPFHTLKMIQPGLTSTGVATVTGNNNTATVIDTARGITTNPAGSAVWPGDNVDVPNTHYAGTESPDPIASCPGYSANTAGTPIVIRLGATPSATSATVTQTYNGSTSTISTCTFDQNTYTNSDSSAQTFTRSLLSNDKGIVIVPQSPLLHRATYNVTVSSGGTNLAWSFRVAGTTPTAPSMNMTPGPASITANITAPSSTGGSPITNYTLTLNPGNRVATVDPADPNYTFTGLTNGTIYTVSVAANNQYGASSSTVQVASPQANAGYWAVTPNGHVDSRGSAAFFGDVGDKHLNAPIVAMTSTPSGNGYWLLGGDGGVFSFGDAAFYGSTGGLHLNAPVIGMAPTKSGHGYWILAKDGGIFSYGDAAFYGSTGSLKLNKPVIDMSVSSTGNGYRLVALDGGIFSFGDAAFYGSMGGEHLNQPVVSMANAPSGTGYWMIGADGGIFAFGPGAPFYGSLVGSGASGEGGARIRATGDGAGYFILSKQGRIYPFGNATAAGDVTAGAVDMTLTPGT
jgi:hypothetical protein